MYTFLSKEEADLGCLTLNSVCFNQTPTSFTNTNTSDSYVPSQQNNVFDLKERILKIEQKLDHLIESVKRIETNTYKPMNELSTILDDIGFSNDNNNEQFINTPIQDNLLSKVDEDDSNTSQLNLLRSKFKNNVFTMNEVRKKINTSKRPTKTQWESYFNSLVQEGKIVFVNKIKKGMYYKFTE